MASARQERTGAVPLVRRVPLLLLLWHGQRQKGHQVLHLAETTNSRVLKGPVAAAGQVQTQEHPGLALSMHHKSTLGARLQRCSPVHLRCLPVHGVG